jgi:hypothetical protein
VTLTCFPDAVALIAFQKLRLKFSLHLTPPFITATPPTVVLRSHTSGSAVGESVLPSHASDALPALPFLSQDNAALVSAASADRLLALILYRLRR